MVIVVPVKDQIAVLARGHSNNLSSNPMTHPKNKDGGLIIEYI